MKCLSLVVCGVLCLSLAARAEAPLDPVAAPAAPAAIVVDKAPTPAKTESAGADLAAVHKAVVERDLLQPLAKRGAERSKFSRAVLPPRHRQVRLLQTTTTNDVHGAAFFPFVLENSYSRGEDAVWSIEWRGCVYVDGGALFVRRDDPDATWQPASVALGKKGKSPPAGVCMPAAPQA